MRLYHDQPSGSIARARQRRHDAPEPERRLLRGLREAFPDLKWRHQAPLGPFIADMLCFSDELVIDVDGDTHAPSAADVAFRASYMARQRYRTLSVTNVDVMSNLAGVVEPISFSLRNKGGTARPRNDADDAPPKKKGGAA